MLNGTVIFVLFITVCLALIASPQPVVFVLNRIFGLRPVVGTRILTKREFVDVETSETFQVWRSAQGFRVWLASAILKI